MDPDMNKYDLNHRVSHHPKMSDAEWEDAYRAAWEAFYAPEHVRTILRRAAACRLGRPKTTLTTLLWFKLVSAYEGVHPLEGGAFRRKFRRDRRDGLPRENPVLFYPRYGPVQRAIRRAFAASGFRGADFERDLRLGTRPAPAGPLQDDAVRCLFADAADAPSDV